MGRWTASDPAGLVDGVNLYVYVRGNPVTFKDDTGNATTPASNWDYLKGAVDTVTRMATGGNTLGDIANAYKQNGGGVKGVAAAYVKSNMMAAAAVDAYKESGGGVRGAVAAAHTMASPGTVIAKGLAKSMAKAYHEDGGGASGAIAAANVINPVYQIGKGVIEAKYAQERGDKRAVGAAVMDAAIGIVSVIPVVKGASALGKGFAAKTMAKAEATAVGETVVSKGKPVGKTSGGILSAHEAKGGHLIERHVGKTEADLATRLSEEPRIRAASSFVNQTEAEMAVSSALEQNAAKLSDWANAGASGRLKLEASFDGGIVMQRGATSAVKGTGVELILQGNGSGEFYIKTGYPTR